MGEFEQANLIFMHPFLRATLDLFKETYALEIKPGKPFLKNSMPAAGRDLVAVFNIYTSDYTAVVALCFMKDVLRSMLSPYPGAPVGVVEAELAAITSGVMASAAPTLKEKMRGKMIIIPTLLEGQEVAIKVISHAPTIVVPLESHRGDFTIEVVTEALT